MTGREGPGPERPGPDYPPEWDAEPEYDDERPLLLDEVPERTRRRGECLSGNPHQWCRWNDACRSCAPIAPTVAVPDPWQQGPVPPPPF